MLVSYEIYPVFLNFMSDSHEMITMYYSSEALLKASLDMKSRETWSSLTTCVISLWYGY